MVKSRLTGGEVGQDIKLGFSKKVTYEMLEEVWRLKERCPKAFLEPRLKKIRVSIFNSTRGEKTKRNKRQETDSGQFVYKHSSFTPHPFCSPWVISRDLCLYWLPAVPFVGVNSSSHPLLTALFSSWLFPNTPRVCSGATSQGNSFILTNTSSHNETFIYPVAFFKQWTPTCSYVVIVA